MQKNPEITKFAEAFNLCEKNNIKIYPVPLSNGSYKSKAQVVLATDYGDGKIIKTEKSFSQNKMHKTIVNMYIEESRKIKAVAEK